MSSKKIWQYPEATSITNDDYILMDSNTETGSQCLKANKIGAVHITKTVTERKVYKASDDNANGFSEVTVAVPYTDVHYDKDDIVSFVGEDLPLKSVTAYIEPQQDLHGYDAPWVGGAGKNKLPMTVDGIKAVNTYHSWSGNSTTINNVTITIETDSVGNVTGIRFNGTASADITFNLATNISIPNGSYKWSNDQIVNISNLWMSLTSPNIAITLSTQKEVNVTVSNDSIGSAYIYASSGNVFNNIVFKPMIRLASITDATFAPYSNICPISGWDEVNVGVVDMLGLELVDSWLTSIGEAHSVDGDTLTINYITLKPFDNPCTLFNDDRTVTISVDSITGVATGVKIQLLDKNNTQVGQITNTSKTFTGVGSKIRIDYGGGGQVIIKGLQIYSNGHTYTIDLDGTRYGGTLDATNGVLTVDRAIRLVSNCTWYGSNGGFYTDAVLSSIQHGDGRFDHVISNVYKTENISSITPLSDGGISVDANGYVQLKDSRYSTASDFKANMGTTQLVYELATPLTFNLDEVSISNLVGDNNFWADTGEIAVEWQTLYVTPTT